jgi:hypothetical protein
MEGRGRCDRAPAKHGRCDPLSSPHHRRPLSIDDCVWRRRSIPPPVGFCSSRSGHQISRGGTGSGGFSRGGGGRNRGRWLSRGCGGSRSSSATLLRRSLPLPSSDASSTLASLWDLRWRAPHRRGTSAGEPTRSIVSLSESLFQLAQQRTRSWRRVCLEHLYALQASMMEAGDSTIMARFTTRVTGDDDALECPSVASSFITVSLCNIVLASLARQRRSMPHSQSSTSFNRPPYHSDEDALFPDHQIAAMEPDPVAAGASSSPARLAPHLIYSSSFFFSAGFLLCKKKQVTQVHAFACCRRCP